jgi:AcrR family transcriptional regulator
MPKLSDATREKRRRHILASAWSCFSRNGFHATSMDDVIAATGMSSSAVYRYFRSKTEIIHASTEEGLARVRAIFLTLLAHDPVPTPSETLLLVVGELNSRVGNPEYDMTRIALQTWAEALRDPVLQKRARAMYRQTQASIAELAVRWRDRGDIAPDADTDAVAATLFSLMHGLIVMHHLVDDVPAADLRDGLAVLGAAVSSSTKREATR